MPNADLLLDTHVWIAVVQGERKFDGKAQRKIEKAARDGQWEDARPRQERGATHAGALVIEAIP